MNFTRFDGGLSGMLRPIMSRSHVILGGLALLIFLTAPITGQAETARAPILKSLVKLAPAANPKVIQLALEAVGCAGVSGLGEAQRLAVIDYSRPSTKPRLWVFDLTQRRLLFEELVAHGKNTGDNYAQAFSNEMNSRATSIGLFRTLEPYHGSNGYSLRMEGLDPGFNDKAKERAIVIHGAPYVTESFAQTHGRLGRSWGCPAVRQAVAQKLINVLKDGQYVFSYYPDTRWLEKSPFLNCQAARTVRYNSAEENTRPTRIASGY